TRHEASRSRDCRRQRHSRAGPGDRGPADGRLSGWWLPRRRLPRGTSLSRTRRRPPRLRTSLLLWMVALRSALLLPVSVLPVPLRLPVPTAAAAVRVSVRGAGIGGAGGRGNATAERRE